MSSDEPTRVVVCGARFGQVYLEAFARHHPALSLVGVLANGSERSRACAEHYGVPLYRSPADLPGDVDVAAVVIRGGLLGGRGAELAQDLLARGIHVVQEHPLHHDELAACLRQARRHKRIYRLNSFYVNVAPVRRFIAAARELLGRQPARYIDAACGFQLAYSMLDILGQALGGLRPWAFADLPEQAPEILRMTDLDIAFRSLDGVLAGVPATLRIQNQMDPADPDNYAHLMHRITIGTEAGNLTLVGTHGPVVWSTRPDFPREVAGTAATPHFEQHAGPVGGASAIVLGPSAVPDYLDIFRLEWPAGVRRALLDLRAAIRAGEDPLRRGQYHLTLCQLWQDITARIGPPQLLRADPPRALDAADLAAIAAAAEKAAEPDGSAPGAPAVAATAGRL